MFEQKSNQQVGISNNSINLRSLVSTVAVVVLIGFSSSLLNGCASSNKQQFLRQIASELNESLPIAVNRDTLLENVTPHPDGLVYNYILVNYSSQDLSPSLLANSLYPQVKNRACSNPDIKLFWEKDILRTLYITQNLFREASNSFFAS